jgi:hypothetical protein
MKAIKSIANRVSDPRLTEGDHALLNRFRFTVCPDQSDLRVCIPAQRDGPRLVTLALGDRDALNDHLSQIANEVRRIAGTSAFVLCSAIQSLDDSWQPLPNKANLRTLPRIIAVPKTQRPFRISVQVRLNREKTIRIAQRSISQTIRDFITKVVPEVAPAAQSSTAAMFRPPFRSSGSDIAPPMSLIWLSFPGPTARPTPEWDEADVSV